MYAMTYIINKYLFERSVDNYICRRALLYRTSSYLVKSIMGQLDISNAFCLTVISAAALELQFERDQLETPVSRC